MRQACKTSGIHYRLIDKIYQEFKIFATTYKMYHGCWVKTVTTDVIDKCGFCPVGVSKRNSTSKPVELFKTIFETKVEGRVTYTRFKPDFIADVKGVK